MIYNNVLEAMGQTPIIQLGRMVPEDSARVLVKFEGLNVGGSIKTRTAYNMIEQAQCAASDRFRQGLCLCRKEEYLPP